jgi:hypothetical protein
MSSEKLLKITTARYAIANPRGEQLNFLGAPV